MEPLGVLMSSKGGESDAPPQKQEVGYGGCEAPQPPKPIDLPDFLHDEAGSIQDLYRQDPDAFMEWWGEVQDFVGTMPSDNNQKMRPDAEPYLSRRYQTIVEDRRKRNDGSGGDKR